MIYKNTLLTGGSGKLGRAIIKSHIFENIISPPHKALDITKPKTIQNIFNKHDIDSVIHCAAVARMKECYNNPIKAIETNISGTINLVSQVVSKEKKINQKIRFIYISTDGVYPGTKGNYSEQDKTIPYNLYGWTKLGGECAVNTLYNHCIIRTSFFDPENIIFEDAPTDAYSSKIPIGYLVKAISKMLNHNYIGTINIGEKRKPEYNRYKEYKSSIKPTKFKDIKKTLPFPLAKDASMKCSLWGKIQKQQT